MFRSLALSIVPVIVGVTAMIVLDAQLGNLTPEKFNLMLKSSLLRGLTLFGAAFAANGNHIIPALGATYLYFLLVRDTNFTQFGDIVNTLFKNDKKKTDPTEDDSQKDDEIVSDDSIPPYNNNSDETS